MHKVRCYKKALLYTIIPNAEGYLCLKSCMLKCNDVVLCPESEGNIICIRLMH